MGRNSRNLDLEEKVLGDTFAELREKRLKNKKPSTKVEEIKKG